MGIHRTHLDVPKSYWRMFNLIFFEVVFLLLLFYAVSLATHPELRNHPWLIGDWLANYQGGFVRRGLVGELLLRVSLLTGVETSIVVISVQMLCYLVFLQRAYSLSAGSSSSPLNVMLICSPAFVLFPILDPHGGFRKELLLFVLLALLCHRPADQRARPPTYPSFLTGIVCVLIVLSHEMLVVFFPYLICAFVIRDKEIGAGAIRTALFMVPAIIVVVLIAVLGRADNQAVADICSSLGTSAPPDCLFPDVVTGAITFLDKDISYAHAHVLAKTSASTCLAYALSAILSFAPLVLKLRSKQSAESSINSSARVWISVCICTALVASLPLLWIVADYGRLIHIHVTCLSLLALMATQERSDAPQRLRFKPRDIGIWVLVVLYVVGWRLPHVEASPQEVLKLFSALGSLLSQ